MKRTPLTRSTPLKSSGGLVRKPMRRKAKPKAPKVEALHMALVATRPCLVCGKWPVEVHHLLQPIPEKRTRRDHRFVLPLCSDHHRGSKGVHGLGSERAVEEMYGKAPFADWARNAWADFQEKARIV